MQAFETLVVVYCQVIVGQSVHFERGLAHYLADQLVLNQHFFDHVPDALFDFARDLLEGLVAELEVPFGQVRVAHVARVVVDEVEHVFDSAQQRAVEVLLVVEEAELLDQLVVRQFHI